MPDQTREEILGSDFSEEFLALMQDRVVDGFKNWGSIQHYIDTKPSLMTYHLQRIEEHLRGFATTKDEKHLADVANHAMFIFMRYRKRPDSITF